MAKRPPPKWWLQPIPDYLRSTVPPLDIPLSDRDFWRDPDPADHALRIDDRWIDAFDAIDNHRDNGQLVDLLLQSDLPLLVRVYLADLIDRKINTKKGGQPVPLYDNSDAEIAMALAVADVRALRKSGLSADAALEQVCQERGPLLEKETLSRAVGNKRSATYRKKQRLAAYLNRARRA